MDIDPDELAKQARPEDEKIATVEKAQTSTDKKLDKLSEEIRQVRKLNLELILSDMYQLSRDLEDANRLLDSIGTVKQYTEMAEIEHRRGTDLAYIACKGYFQEAGRDVKIAQISLVAIKDVMNRLQEKLMTYEDFDMLEDREGIDSDIVEQG